MKKTKVAINGFGRIGRAFLKLAWDRNDLEIVAINDLGSLESLAYLLKYDTVYGKWNKKIDIQDNFLIIEDKKISFFSIKETNQLPWKDLDIDVAVEATGVFTSYDKANFHLEQGAKKVVISAPVKKDNIHGLKQSKGLVGRTSQSEVLGETILLGINEEKFGTCDITSNASCTTNAASPLIAILDENLGIEKAILNTVHGYTATQALVDGPSKKDLREGRAAAQNIIPSSTGAAIAMTEAFPSLKNLFDGISIRVPVVCGSIVDITFISKKETNAEEVNNILKQASQEERWKKLFTVTEEPIVSTDILGESYACIADLALTRVVGGNLIKVMGWYDNEMGYTHTLIDHVIKTGESS